MENSRCKQFKARLLLPLRSIQLDTKFGHETEVMLSLRTKCEVQFFEWDDEVDSSEHPWLKLSWEIIGKTRTTVDKHVPTEAVMLEKRYGNGCWSWSAAFCRWSQKFRDRELGPRRPR